MAYGGAEDDRSGLKRIGFEIHLRIENDARVGGGTQSEDDNKVERGCLVKEERHCCYFVTKKTIKMKDQ
jgi:hypothetical protein